MLGLKFAGVEITAETFALTCQHFADNAQGCIDEVKSGEVRVNDPESYFDECESRKARYLAHDVAITFTFLQRAHSIQTGECVALLP